MTPEISKQGVQKDGDVSQVHNVKLWDEWFYTNYQDKFCTFQIGNDRHIGRIHKYGKFLGFMMPSNTPNYEIVIKGPSQKEVTVNMESALIEPCESLEQAENDAGYTWASRFRFAYSDAPKRLSKAQIKNHHDTQKERLEAAQHDWERTPWPMNATPDNLTDKKVTAQEHLRTDEEKIELMRLKREEIRNNKKPAPKQAPKVQEGFLL
jgi:hypothetical protein